MIVPFQSESQRRFLWAKHPEVAERWAHKYGTPENLPEHKSSPAEGAMKSIKRFFSGESGEEREQKRRRLPQGSTGSRG